MRPCSDKGPGAPGHERLRLNGYTFKSLLVQGYLRSLLSGETLAGALWGDAHGRLAGEGLTGALWGGSPRSSLGRHPRERRDGNATVTLSGDER